MHLPETPMQAGPLWSYAPTAQGRGLLGRGEFDRNSVHFPTLPNANEEMRWKG